MNCIQNSKRRADSALNPRKRESRAKSAPQNGFPKRTKILSVTDETATTPGRNQTQNTPSDNLLESEIANSNNDADNAEAPITSEILVESNGEDPDSNIVSEPNTIASNGTQNESVFGSNSSSILPSFRALIEKKPEDNEDEAKTRAQTDGEASGENTDNDDEMFSGMRVAVDFDPGPQQKKKYKLKQRKP